MDQTSAPVEILIRDICIKIGKNENGFPYQKTSRLTQRWADAQTDLSLRWVHTYFVGFVCCICETFSRLETNAELKDLHWTSGIKPFCKSPFTVSKSLWSKFFQVTLIDLDCETLIV